MNRLPPPVTIYADPPPVPVAAIPAAGPARSATSFDAFGQHFEVAGGWWMHAVKATPYAAQAASTARAARSPATVPRHAPPLRDYSALVPPRLTATSPASTASVVCPSACGRAGVFAKPLENMRDCGTKARQTPENKRFPSPATLNESRD